jgi:hypothetical protein
MLVLGPQGSQANEISTEDQQALVTFSEAVIAARPGESSVRVTITPLDPASVGPAPAGRHFDGNAYRIDAVYAAASTPAVLSAPVTVVLRYAVHATQMLQFQDGGWVALRTIRFDGSQQLLANTDRLGIFVPATSSGGGVRPPSTGASLAATAALVTAVRTARGKSWIRGGPHRGREL